MHRLLLLLVGAALFVACVPSLDTKQSAVASADEAFNAINEMAYDKGWTVTAVSETSIIVREPRSSDDDELIYTVVIGDDGSQLTLNIHRIVGGFGQVFVEKDHYYTEFFDELAAYL